MSSEMVTQLISIGGSVVTTMVAAWAKSYFERRKANGARERSTKD